MLHSLYENKNYENLNRRIFSLQHVTFDLYAYHSHTRLLAAGVKCKASSLNDVSIGSLPRRRNGVTFLIPVDRYQHQLALLQSRKQVMLALLYTAHKCERYQLCMRAISRSKHTKLKNTKIYSKGVLVNHTKISTNENIPLYGS